jgi:hypothetical protein
MVALTLASEFQRKFGGDTVEEFVAAHRRYVDRMAERLER